MPTANSIEPPYDILLDIIRDVGFEILVSTVFRNWVLSFFFTSNIVFFIAARTYGGEDEIRTKPEFNDAARI